MSGVWGVSSILCLAVNIRLQVDQIRRLLTDSMRGIKNSNLRSTSKINKSIQGFERKILIGCLNPDPEQRLSSKQIFLMLNSHFQE